MVVQQSCPRACWPRPEGAGDIDALAHWVLACRRGEASDIEEPVEGAKGGAVGFVWAVGVAY